MDYGFTENVEKSKAYKLNPKFCSLSFQATKCKLAGKGHFLLVCFELVLHLGITPGRDWETIRDARMEPGELCTRQIIRGTF